MNLGNGIVYGQLSNYRRFACLLHSYVDNILALP